MDELGQKMSQVGQDLTMKVTVPIVAAGAAAVDKYAEVDKTMNLANQTMGNTTEEANMLNQAMSEAAANSTFGMSDAANAVLNFARAGLDAEQAAAALAPAMNLAAGEGGNLDTVSAGLVATINGFQDSFENAGAYADVFASACNNSALDINSLSEAMSVAAPIFAAAGYDVKDAALYMGTMANNGIEASVAANSLKTGMARLAKPAKEGAEMLDKLGISVFNTDGTMKDSLEVQKLLHDSFANLSEQEQLAAASAIFGKNNMSSWLALINTAPKDVKELSDELHHAAGTTDEMAEAMMSGFGGSIEKLKSSLDVLMTNLGRLAAMYLQPLIDKIQALVDKFLSLDEGTQRTIIKIAGIAAAIGPVLLVGGKLISGIGKVLTFAPKIVSAVNTVMSLASPWMLVVAAVIAAGVLIYKNWDTIKEKAQQLGEWVSEKWSAMKEKVSGFAEGMKEKVSTAWEGMKDRISGAKDKIAEKVDSLKESFQVFGTNIKEKWSSTWETLSPILEEKFAPVKAVFDGILQTLRGVFDIFAGLFTGDWERMHEGISQVFTGAWEAIQSHFEFVTGLLKSGADAFLSLFGIDWQTAWSGVKTFFENTWNSISNFFTTKWTAIKETVSGAMGNVKETLGTGWDTAKERVTGLVENIRTGVTTKWENIQSRVSGVTDTMKSALQNKWESIKGTTGTKVDAIKAKVSSAFDAISSKATTVWENIKNAILNPIETAKEGVRTALERMKSFFNFTWSLPHIALPHFSISGTFSLNPPSIPHFSVSWYKKAMDGGMILDNPTIFGMMNGQLLGGGEAGSEAVVGTQSLMQMIQKAVSAVNTAANINYGGVTVNVYGAEGQSISELADEIEERINFGVARKTAAWA